MSYRFTICDYFFTPLISLKLLFNEALEVKVIVSYNDVCKKKIIFINEFDRIKFRLFSDYSQLGKVLF